MKVLVIYEMIPEETIMSIVEMTAEEYEYFKCANGFIINANIEDEHPLAEEANMVMQNALSDNPEYVKYCETDKQREYFGKWSHSYNVEDISDVDRLIKTGFYL